MERDLREINELVKRAERTQTSLCAEHRDQFICFLRLVMGVSKVYDESGNDITVRFFAEFNVLRNSFNCMRMFGEAANEEDRG